MITEYSGRMERPLSLYGFELRRLLRDPKIVVGWLAVFGLPLLAVASAGSSGLWAVTATSLFLPVLVGWSWGADLATGRLAPLVLGRISKLILVAVRVTLFATGVLLGLLLLLLAARPPLRDALLVTATSLELLCLGFATVTILGGPHGGWVPIFIAIAGVWSPLVLTLKLHDSSVPPAWLRALALILAPRLGTGLEFLSPEVATLALAGLSILWLFVSAFSFTVRMGSVHPASD